MSEAKDANLIGHGTCPLCGSAKARFTLMKTKLACMTCNACNTQIFARSDRSDELLRKNIKPGTPAPEPTPAPAPEPTPAPAPAPTPAPEQKPKPAAPGWGLMGVFGG